MLTHLSTLPFACGEEGCDFTTATNSRLDAHHKHMHEEHIIPDEQKIHSCTECDYITAFSYSLRMHILTHYSGQFPCNHPGCNYMAKTPPSLKIHMLRHLDVLPFACGEDDCDFTTTTNDQLKRHHKCVHEDSKELECHFPDCHFSAKLESNLRQHLVTHTTELPFVCPTENCNFATKTKRNLENHMLIHTGRELKFPCTHNGCEYKSAYKDKLERHMMRHTGETRFSCDFPGCGHKCVTSSDMKRHQKTHTPGAQLRHKKQEKRVTKMLTEWGYSYDPEVTINAARGNCVPDTNRHYSRLDYHILNITSCIVLLEVDEHQHFFYNLSCELGRMSDVRTSLMKAGYELPIYWIRYNPNGKYSVDFEEVKISREKRELALKAKLDELCSPDFVPDNEVSIHYMYYDLMSEEMGPEIMYDEAFPEVMREVVSWS